MTKSAKWFVGILGVLALLAIFFTVLMLSLFSTSTEPYETTTVGSGQKIAVVEINGEIVSSDEVVRQIKKYRKDRSIKAILLRVDSPGGGVVASQEMYEEVRKTREAGKPVVVSMGSLAASGGYYVSCGASRLVANPGTLTGSIGVVSEFWQVHDALNKLGIDLHTIKSGSLKDAGLPTKKMTEQEQRYFQSLIDNVQRQFVAVVEEERKLPHDKVLALADGRAFTGEQALAEGLVDTLGTYEDALAIAAELAGIQGEPAVVKERRRASWWDSLFGTVSDRLRDAKQELLDRPVLSYRYGGPY
jgi:protease-4